MKKLCKNCKYWNKNWDLCSKSVFKKDKEKSNIVGVDMGRLEVLDYTEENKNNDCKYYEEGLFKRLFNFN